MMKHKHMKLSTSLWQPHKVDSRNMPEFHKEVHEKHEASECKSFEKYEHAGGRDEKHERHKRHKFL